ncbi:hypothetical protein C7B80_19195 [Cyanosarcina cf. burmensis CCALA 770]|nr:hypothetical protein C7B80_19195 [Cyanosarcina cf. burmensis CCALA 770]
MNPTSKVDPEEPKSFGEDMKFQNTCQVLISTYILSGTLVFSSAVPLTALATLQAGSGETIAQPAKLAQQRILYVNPQQGRNSTSAGTRESTPLKTITYALQQAESGTVIQLASGQYQTGETFPLQLKPGVFLRGNESQQGEGVAIVGGGEHSSQVFFTRQNSTVVTAGNSQISGVTITNPNTRGTGIWVESTNPIIRRNTFTNSKREGIFVTGTANPKIQNNLLTNNEANGISVTGAAKGEIRGNVFQNNGFGLAIGGSSTPLVADNQIRESRNGVVVTEKARPTLQGNQITNNSEYGLVVIGEAQPKVGNNDLQGNGFQEQLISRVPQGVAPTPTDRVEGSQSPTGNASTPARTPAVAQIPARPQGEQATSFSCAKMGAGITAIAQQGSASIPQPTLAWNRDLVPTDLTPEQLCQVVTQRLNQLVAENGGNLKNLLLTVGSVDKKPGVCLVNNIKSGCNQTNLVLSLNPEMAQKATDILQNLVAFDVPGSGNAVQESQGQPFVSLAAVAESLAPAKGLWFVSGKEESPF